jgi:RNA polymerase sigma-70 factor (ECF subfamily)
MDETALIRSAKGGDLDAFNRLVLAYQDDAYNVAYRMMGDPDQAADIVQLAFISAYKKIRSFRSGSFQAWLLRIVANASYDEIRRQRRHPTISLNPFAADDPDIIAPDWMGEENGSPEELFDRAELVDAIQECIERLSAEFRAVLVLVDVQGMSYAESAETIGRPVGTVKSRLARARTQIQECLQGFRELLPAEFRLKGEG